MKKKLLIVGIVAILLICVGLSGCNEQSSESSEENKFLGTWINDVGEITIFHENGTTTSILGDLQGTGTWKLENDSLIITFGLILTFDYSFSNNDETLTLINVDTGLTFVHIKQK
ncbi:unnamed protein product [marine sediment metagenome]|uniref:Uncharacterized protein n=1 Tax=marine sediment metagenome TaxID=412755 RepID=X1EAF7_9ZZZZ